MENATRSKQNEVNWDDDVTPAHGVDLAHIDTRSLTFDPDPTQIIPDGVLTELCTEAVRRDTAPPVGLYSEESLVEALAAAQSVVAENLVAKR